MASSTWHMEDFEDNDTIAADASDTAEVPEEDLEAVNESDAIEDKIDEAIGDGLQMEAFIDVITAFKADGGMNQNAAKMAKLQLEGFTKRNYLRPTSLPQMESFDGTDGKHNATNLVLEGFKEAKDKWWEKIKSWLKSFVKSIIKFWNKYLSDSARLARKAKALEEKCNDKKGKPDPDNKEIKLSTGQVKALQGSNGQVSLAGIKSGLAELEKEVKRCGSDTTAAKNIKGLAKTLSDIKVNTLDELKAWNKDTWSNINAAATSFSSAIGAGGGVTSSAVSGDLAKVLTNPSDTNTYVYGSELIGRQHVVGQFIGNEDGLTSIRIGLRYVGKAKLEEQSIDSLGVTAIKELAKEVGSLAKTISEVKINYQERAKLTEEIIKTGDTITKTVKKFADEANKEAATKAKLAALKNRVYQLVGTASSVLEPQADLQKHGVVVGNAVFNYAARSFSNIKSKIED